MSYRGLEIVGGKVTSLEAIRRAGFAIGLGVVVFTLALLALTG